VVTCDETRLLQWYRNQTANNAMEMNSLSKTKQRKQESENPKSRKWLSFSSPLKELLTFECVLCSQIMNHKQCTEICRNCETESEERTGVVGECIATMAPCKMSYKFGSFWTKDKFLHSITPLIYHSSLHVTSSSFFS
jgi:hypothetical protein